MSIRMRRRSSDGGRDGDGGGSRELEAGEAGEEVVHVGSEGGAEGVVDGGDEDTDLLDGQPEAVVAQRACGPELSGVRLERAEVGGHDGLGGVEALEVSEGDAPHLFHRTPGLLMLHHPIADLDNHSGIYNAVQFKGVGNWSGEAENTYAISLCLVL